MIVKTCTNCGVNTFPVHPVHANDDRLAYSWCVECLNARRRNMIYEDEQPDTPIIRRENYEDDYTFQTARQNAGLPCSNCWAKSGHYDRCNMFSSEWDQAAVDTLDRMARLAGEPDVEWVPNFSEEDLVRLKGMGIIAE